MSNETYLDTELADLDLNKDPDDTFSEENEQLRLQSFTQKNCLYSRSVMIDWLSILQSFKKVIFV